MPYVRKTSDVWIIQCNWGSGWEDDTTEDNRTAARAQLKCYRANVSVPVRMVKRRERIAA